MNLRRWLTGCALVLVMGAVAASEDWPLVFPDDPAWNIEKPDGDLDFFVLESDGVGGPFFSLSSWPHGTGAEGASAVVRGIADSVEEKTSWFTRLFRKEQGYETEAIEGAVFSGEAAVWRYRDGDVVAVFMVEDGQTGWQGQFGGTPEAWAEAKTLLEALRPAAGPSAPGEQPR